jgi:hypothetical protein
LAASRRKVSKDFGIDRHGPIHCQAKPPLPHAPLRRQRRTGKEIAAELSLSPAAVSRILQRRGINKLT